jgi:cytochrome c peroxidase
MRKLFSLNCMFFYLILFNIHNSYGAKNEYKVEKFELGRLLFFDKIISGNKNISCASCHHPLTGSGDGLSLPLGEGARGLGISRAETSTKIHERVPRNSPHLFNVGHEDIPNYFADGRVEKNKHFQSNAKTPAGHDLPEGFESILAAQAVFPITSPVEMAGQAHENEIGASASISDFKGVWRKTTSRIVAIAEYVELFKKAYPNKVTSKEDINITHIGNAIATFEKNAFKANDAPYDRYISGDLSALSNRQIQGMKLFNQKGKCISCHSGELFSDFKFYSISQPQIGPGKGVGFKSREDFGRELVTKNIKDRYRFRTPSLRNIKVTAPYGHSGAYNSLNKMIQHHVNPEKMLLEYNIDKNTSLPIIKNSLDSIILNNKILNRKILASSDLPSISIVDSEIDLIIEFLGSLTDERCLDMRKFVPKRVPSNLPVFD